MKTASPCFSVCSLRGRGTGQHGQDMMPGFSQRPETHPGASKVAWRRSWGWGTYSAQGFL